MQVQRKHLSKHQKVSTIKNQIVIFLLLSFGTLSAQSELGVAMPDLEWEGVSQVSEIAAQLDRPVHLAAPYLFTAPIATNSLLVVPKAYDFHALGVFCKFDVYLDKGSKIPLRFRLGTVGGMDELERKGPTRYNY